MLEISDLKNSLRIDHDFDDEMIAGLLEVAKQYVADAVSSKELPSEITEKMQYKMAVSLLTQHWYQNRDEANVKRMPDTVMAMIQQLRGFYNSGD